MELVHGRPAVSNPPGSTSRFGRRNFVGKKAAKRGDYEPAVAKGHTAVLLLMEVTGGLHPEALSFLRALAALHDRKLPIELAGQSWSRGPPPPSSRTSSSVSRAQSTWRLRARSVTRSCPAPASRARCVVAAATGRLRAPKAAARARRHIAPAPVAARLLFACMLMSAACTASRRLAEALVCPRASLRATCS
eukprot:3544667-Prymnesium_polylepis.3